MSFRFWLKGEETGERSGKILEFGQEEINIQRYETTSNL